MDATPGSGTDIAAAWDRFGRGLRTWFARRVRQAADADDLVQQVFLKVAASSPDDLPEARVGAWLYRVAHNVLVDSYRRESVRRTDSLAPDMPESAPDDPEWSSLTRCLAPMIRALPPDHAEAVRRADLEGESQRALAEELGVSYSAIKSRVQRGRRMLEQRLIECCTPGEADSDTACDESACS